MNRELCGHPSGGLDFAVTIASAGSATVEQMHLKDEYHVLWDSVGGVALFAKYFLLVHEVWVLFLATSPDM